MDISSRLAAENFAEVLAVEPNIKSLPANLEAANIELVSLNDALERANVLVVLVDHAEFKALSSDQINTKVVVDTRGLFSRY